MKRITWLAAAVVLAGLLGGCNVDKQYNWDYGRAYHTVFENQKLDPNAGDDSPVTGMDGKVAAAAYARYETAKPRKDDKKAPRLVEFQGK